MASKNWYKIPLKKLCSRIGDGIHGTPNYVDNGDVYFINGNNLKNGRIEITKDTKTVTEAELKNSFIPLNENSLLLSINGTLGSMAFFNNEKVMLGKSAAYLNFNSNINRFYYYYFQLKGIQNYFYDVATGSTIKNLSLKSIQDFEVPIPEEFEWKGIVKTLSSIDAKIELNNRINRELEAMAKTLYDYWFVQFDFPVRTLSGVEGYKSSGGKMVYNAELKREIPEGWEVKKLIEIEYNIITGKTPSTKVLEYFGGDIPFITIDDIRGQLFILHAERTLSILGADSQSTKYLHPGAICVSCIGTIGVIGIVSKLSQTNQQINSIAVKNSYNRYFLLNALKNYFDFNVAAKKGAVLSNMNKAEFSDIPILDSRIDVKEEFNKIVEPLYNKIEINLKQNQHLTALRDWLLPMLMNGQVTVRQAHGNAVKEAEERLSSSAERSRSMAAEPSVEYKKG